MRILQISYILPPRLNVADGVTAVVHSVSYGLARRGHDVTVCVSNAADLKSERRISPGRKDLEGVEIQYHKTIARYRTFYLTPGVLSFYRHIREYDIVHIHDVRSFQALAAYPFLHKSRIPYVVSTHGGFSSSLPEGMLDRLLRFTGDSLLFSTMVRSSRKVLTSNRTEASSVARILHIPESNIDIVPNALPLQKSTDLPQRGTFRNKIGIPQTSRLVLYVGRIHRSKGISLLIRMIEELRRVHGEDLYLAVVGPDDGFLESARDLVSHLHLESRVFFTGFLSPAQKREALVDADLFATPTYTGFPITFLEACSVGLPILTTTLADELELVRATGIISEPNPRAMADSVLRAFKDQDAMSQRRLSCIRAVQEQFGIDAVAERLERIYTNAIESLRSSNAGFASMQKTVPI